MKNSRALDLILDRVVAWNWRRGLDQDRRAMLAAHQAALPDLADDGSLQFQSISEIAKGLRDTCGKSQVYEVWQMNYVSLARSYAQKLWPVSAVYLVAFVYDYVQYEEPTEAESESLGRWIEWAKNGYEGPEPLS